MQNVKFGLDTTYGGLCSGISDRTLYTRAERRPLFGQSLLLQIYRGGKRDT